MHINLLTIYEQKELLERGDCTVFDLVLACQKAEESNRELNAYLEFFEDSLVEAKKLIVSQKADFLSNLPDLYGIPGAIKNNIAIAGRKMTCASKMLKSFVSPYDASVISKLKESSFVNVGCVNHDEFAIGSSGCKSGFAAVLNPLDRQCFSGGSSSGSAVAVAMGMTSFALGTDTGGSCRLPASNCGIYGFKPTYGGISRYGVAACAPSFDTVGILARSARDIDLILQVIAGQCPKDASSINIDNLTGLNESSVDVNLKGLKVAVFPQLIEKTSISVKKAHHLARTCLMEKGAEIREFDLGMEDLLLGIYYITTCSEIASSLSRYDGVHCGQPESSNYTFEDPYFISELRAKQLGYEVRRRILLGNFFLSEKNYQQYYSKAVELRESLINRGLDIQKAGFSVYLLPGFSEAKKTDANEEDTYASDLCAVFSNLMGVPALTVPVYLNTGKLPVSFQLSGIRGSDRHILSIGHYISQILGESCKVRSKGAS